MQTLLLANVEVTTGISEKSGSPKPYQISSATVLNPALGFERGNRKSVSVGLTSSELSVADVFFPELMATFERDFDGVPIAYDFETTMDGNGKIILMRFAKKPAAAPFIPTDKKA